MTVDAYQVVGDSEADEKMFDHEALFGKLDGDRKYRDNERYFEFCKTYVPCVIQKSKWKENCYRKKLCDYVTPSDEAFMIWTFSNYCEWWKKRIHYEEKYGKPENKEEREKMNEEVGKPLWTSGGKSVSDGSTVKGCGVTDDGIREYSKIFVTICKERHGSEFDQNFLEQLRLGKPPGKKRKRPAKNKDKMDSITEATNEMFRIMEELENNGNVVGV